MKKNVSLSIPRPCAESWSSFTPTADGGFCGSCQKTVIDFSRMSDHEILAYIEKKREAHICGRFRTSQLKTYALPEPNSIRPGFMLLRAGVLGLLLLLVNRPVSAKNIVPITPTIEMTRGTSQPNASVSATAGVDHVIRGIVRDDTGAPLPGAYVVHKGTDQGTTTDAEGRFQFPDKLKAGDILTVSFIGFTSEDYVVPKTSLGQLDIEITLATEFMLTGDLVMDTPYEETPTFDVEAPVAPKR